jgi:hypothetical protein
LVIPTVNPPTFAEIPPNVGVVSWVNAVPERVPEADSKPLLTVTIVTVED